MSEGRDEIDFDTAVVSFKLTKILHLITTLALSLITAVIGWTTKELLDLKLTVIRMETKLEADTAKINSLETKVDKLYEPRRPTNPTQ